MCAVCLPTPQNRRGEPLRLLVTLESKPVIHPKRSLYSPSRRDFLKSVGGVAMLSAFPATVWASGHSSHSDTGVAMFRGNPARNFYGTGPMADRYEVAWTFRTEDFNTRLHGEAYSWSGTGWTGQASCLDGMVYFGSVDRHIYALDASNGAFKWAYRAPKMFKSSLCVYGNLIFSGNVDNRVHCIRRQTGEPVWTFKTRSDVDSSPVVADDRLYIGGEDSTLYCLDPSSGDVLWKEKVNRKEPSPPGGKGIESSPAVANGRVFASSYSGYVYAFDAETGTKLWSFETGDDTDSTPTLVGDLLYIGCESGELFCLTQDEGKKVWKVKFQI